MNGTSDSSGAYTCTNARVGLRNGGRKLDRTIYPMLEAMRQEEIQYFDLTERIAQRHGLALGALRAQIEAQAQTGCMSTLMVAYAISAELEAQRRERERVALQAAEVAEIAAAAAADGELTGFGRVDKTVMAARRWQPPRRFK